MPGPWATHIRQGCSEPGNRTFTVQVGGEGEGCGEEERAMTGVTDVPSVPASVTGRWGIPELQDLFPLL